MVSLHAAPLVPVKVALHVMAPTVAGGKGKHRTRAARTVVLYRIGSRGRTDAHGRLTGRLLVTYRPGERVRALVTVITPARCGAAKSSVVVTLEPWQHHLTRYHRSKSTDR